MTRTSWSENAVRRSSISRRLVAYVIALSWIIQPSFAQQSLDQLLVHGDDFIFSVKEPPGWKGDSTTAAKYQSNLILHETSKPQESASGLIRIRIDDKLDENTSADLKEDLRGYQVQYPKIQFKELLVRNQRYLCLAKVFYIPGEFYEYVTYVNPGPGKPFLFSVSMNTQKSEASAKELEAYKSAVQSLRLLKP